MQQFFPSNRQLQEHAYIQTFQFFRFDPYAACVRSTVQYTVLDSNSVHPKKYTMTTAFTHNVACLLFKC